MKQGSRVRRGSAFLGVVVIVASVAGYLWLQNAGQAQKQKIAYLEGLSARLRSETVPLKFMVLSREGGSIKARIKLYDAAGREVAVLEKSWQGAELYIDVLLVPVRTEKASAAADAWLAFPYRIFTNEIAAARGTLLFDAYDGGGFPEVFKGVEWSAAERAEIQAAFSKARDLAKRGMPATEAVKGAFGSASHEMASLSLFEEGIVYKVVCRVKGGIEIMEE